MKRLIMALAAGTSLLGSQAAMAQHSNPYATPAATPAFVWQGDVVVSKFPVTLFCTIRLELSGPDNNPDAGGPGVSHTDFANMTGTATFVAGTGCPILTVNPITNISYNSVTSKVTLHNVYVNTNLVPGDCNDDLVLDWLGGGQAFQVPFQTLQPGDPLTSQCTVEGELEKVSPAGTITFLP